MADPGDSLLYVGVDVGTQCVRAGLFTGTGRLVAAASRAIDVLEPEPDLYEQSSENIWESCCQAVKTVVANVPKAQIHGIGFDATCSLVVLDRDMKPLTVSPTEEDRWNIVMWLDHRAGGQANVINLTQHEVLKFSGGIVSLEMEMPKLLWLKQNMKKQCWDKAGHFFDLPDFLTWRATGNFSRSLCALVCKWNYHVDGSTQAWNDSFLKQIGLEDLIENGYEKIGNTVQSPGSPCGSGLTPEAAAELGLNPHTAVATSIIDAHAGALGTLGCKVAGIPEVPLSSRLAIVCGTSSCHICKQSTEFHLENYTDNQQEHYTGHGSECQQEPDTGSQVGFYPEHQQNNHTDYEQEHFLQNEQDHESENQQGQYSQYQQGHQLGHESINQQEYYVEYQEEYHAEPQQENYIEYQQENPQEYLQEHECMYEYGCTCGGGRNISRRPECYQQIYWPKSKRRRH